MRFARTLSILASLSLLAGPIQAQWTTDSLSVARHQLSATTVGTKAIFAGGFYIGNNIPVGVVDTYDSATGAWTVTYLSIPRGWLAAATVGSKALFAGGREKNFVSSNVVDIYDDSTGTWSTTTLSQARHGLVATAHGSKVYFAGGWNLGTSAPVAVIDIYNSLNGAWSVASLSVARTDLAVTVVGSKVMFAGGWDGSNYSNVIDVFDSSTSTWSTETLSQPRGRLSAVTVGDKAIFAGGGATGTGDSDRVDIYDNVTHSWSTATLSAPREFMGATTVGRYAIFGGGWDGSAGATSALVDIYDERAGSWSISSLSAARWGSAATTLDDRGMIAGGAGVLLAGKVIDIYTPPNTYAYCFGDPGAGTHCPCNNENDLTVPHSGCANGVFASGAQMTDFGVARLGADTLILATTHMEPNQSGLYFQGNNALSPGQVWGDGFQCAGGQLKRLGVVAANVNGYSNTWAFPQSISATAGGLQAGDTRYYQCWYRNPQNSPCGSDFNASNGIAVTWLP